MTRTISLALFLATASFAQSANAQSAEINTDVAKAYNEGLVRCTNAECAKFLYACFRTYAATTLPDFLSCGTMASRLNDNLQVVEDPDQS